MSLVEEIIGTSVEEELNEVTRFFAEYKFKIIDSEIVQNLLTGEEI